MAGRAAEQIDEIRPIGDQTASGGPIPSKVHRGQTVPSRQRYEEIAMRYSQGASGHDEAAIGALRECRDGMLDLTFVPHVKRTQLHTKRRRNGLNEGETGR